MSKLTEIIKQIEELRSNMIKIKEGKSYTDPEVIAASQKLDAVLNKYQEMMMEIRKRKSTSKTKKRWQP